MLIAGMDPCFSCNDRVITTVDQKGSRHNWSWTELRTHGIEHYKK
jgi:NADH-quinone oxidoreductase subunit D